MIVTVTPNPSIDRTVTLGTPLTRGAVHRVTSVTTEPGGKGVNVARALTLAGLDAVALLPAADSRPHRGRACTPGGALPVRADHRRGADQPRHHRIRRHHNETQRAGRRTRRGAAAGRAHPRRVRRAPRHASWVVLSGSLPPGLPDDWYADVVALLAPLAVPGGRRHVRTPARRVGGRASVAPRPTCIKPNAEELAGLVGASAEALETAAAQGDPEPVVAAAQEADRRGVGTVLVTLGAAGAVLVDRDRAAGWPRRRRSPRAAPSAQATPRWPDTCAPRSAEPSRRNACRWPSRTAAPPPRSPVRHCRHRPDRSRTPFGCMRLRPLIHPPNQSIPTDKRK